MTKRIIFLFFYFSIIGLANLSAQINLTSNFQTKLAAAGVNFLTPVEHNFKIAKVHHNNLQDYDFAIREKKDKVEIRYLVLPDTGIIAGGYPHLNFGNRTMTLASNADDEASSAISILQLSKKTLTEKYHADWGAISFFTPKKSFADTRYCKMVALYREGLGYVYTFFLYNDVNTEFNARYDLLEFKGIKNINAR